MTMEMTQIGALGHCQGQRCAELLVAAGAVAAAIDAVVLPPPHSRPCEQMVAAAKAGKHVFVEKPLGVDSKSAEEAVAACAQHKVTLAVGYNWRFQPALQEAKRMLEDGRLG